MGRKERTLPTPAQTPLIRREISHGVTRLRTRKDSKKAVKLSIQALSKSCKGAPSTEKVSQKISIIISRKIGIPRYLLVSSRSIFSERSCSRVS